MLIIYDLKNYLERSDENRRYPCNLCRQSVSMKWIRPKPHPDKRKGMLNKAPSAVSHSLPDFSYCFGLINFFVIHVIAFLRIDPLIPLLEISNGNIPLPG